MGLSKINRHCRKKKLVGLSRFQPQSIILPLHAGGYGGIPCDHRRCLQGIIVVVVVMVTRTLHDVSVSMASWIIIVVDVVASVVW